MEFSKKKDGNGSLDFELADNETMPILKVLVGVLVSCSIVKVIL